MSFSSQRLYKTLEWSPFFRQLQEFGTSQVQPSFISSVYASAGDAHVIQSRLFHQDIPNWIRKAFPIRLEIVMLFGTLPGSLGKYHKDGLTRKAALNIPLCGGDKGCLEWSAEDLVEHRLVSPGKEVRTSKREYLNVGLRLNVPVRDRLVLTTPALVNTDEWHRVNNTENDEYRFVLSLRFFGNPNIDLLDRLLNFE